MTAMTVPSRTLTGCDLDCAVAMAEAKRLIYGTQLVYVTNELHASQQWSPSTNWRQGSPLMRKHGIRLEQVLGSSDGVYYTAKVTRDGYDYTACSGTTALEAAMRLIVIIHFGEQVRLPDREHIDC